MYLSDLKFIDLKHSDIDEENSDPKRGKYVFKKKVYLSYRDKGRRPVWYYTWCRYSKSNDYADLQEWQARWAYQLVKSSEGEIWPEGLAPDAEGSYRFGDLIAVKCPLLDHLKRAEQEAIQSMRASKSKFAQFAEQNKAQGVALPEGYIETLIDELLPKTE